MPSSLDQLRALSTIVADSGDIAAIRRVRPVDATTNPSLVLKAVDAGGGDVAEWMAAARASSTQLDQQRWWLSARFASAIQDSVERWVSLEADATLSYDTAGTIACAHALLEAVARTGGDPARILIKIAATWEGIRAARVLEATGIRCNLTLIFSLAQAQLCAEGGITLISPFVGRITDWHTARGEQFADADEDPGVQSVRRIADWVKRGGYTTLVMGASFRSTAQVLGLAGCDLLTVAPDLLDALAASADPVESAINRLDPAQRAEGVAPDHGPFLQSLAEDAMAGEKLLEGIRRFAVDQRALEQRLAR